MSNNKLQINGLDELRNALRNLPEHLAQEAGAIVIAHAEDAQQRVQAAYPQGPTGNLRKRVTVNRESARYGARAVVRSRAPHAWMFENGTVNRTTDKGLNRGRMPEAPSNQKSIPIFIRVRRTMVAALINMVQAAGLTVTSS